MNAIFALPLAALALTLGAAASAQTPPATPVAAASAAPVRDFASHKAAVLAQLDQRLAAMTTARGCVASAATDADLKACRPPHQHGRMHPKRAQ